MFEYVHYFSTTFGINALALPFDYRKVIKDWAALRIKMVRKVPDEFTRDEWAYLVAFLDEENLTAPFLESFGEEMETTEKMPSRLFRPRGSISVWLPNNVSLLGPLTLIYLSLTGQAIRLKPGSSAEDLTGEFLNFAIDNLPSGELKTYLATQISTHRFGREDERQRELAADASVRVVFGSNEAAEAIQGLPQPPASVGFSFTDRQSEAWIEPAALTEEVMIKLIKVFAVYGQAGCTSPRRVILLGGSDVDGLRLRDDLLELWPEAIPVKPPMHMASANVMAAQLARARGWDARCCPSNAAVLTHGGLDLPEVEEPATLSILCATPEQALATLPPNIQTIGHALEFPGDPAWLSRLANSNVLRFVALERMHHFNSIWDGQEFWRQCFEPMEIQP